MREQNKLPPRKSRMTGDKRRGQFFEEMLIPSSNQLTVCGLEYFRRWKQPDSLYSGTEPPNRPRGPSPMAPAPTPLVCEWVNEAVVRPSEALYECSPCAMYIDLPHCNTTTQESPGTRTQTVYLSPYCDPDAGQLRVSGVERRRTVHGEWQRGLEAD